MAGTVPAGERGLQAEGLAEPGGRRPDAGARTARPGKHSHHGGHGEPPPVAYVHLSVEAGAAGLPVSGTGLHGLWTACGHWRVLWEQKACGEHQRRRRNHDEPSGIADGGKGTAAHLGCNI